MVKNRKGIIAQNQHGILTLTEFFGFLAVDIN